MNTRIPRFAPEFAPRTRRGVLTTKDGIEVSIPNIIVAITISIAVIASVVLGVIWVVPWAQDNAARSQLQTIQSAEQLLYADTGSYGPKATLLAPNTRPDGTTHTYLMDNSSHYLINGDKTTYCAGIYSDSGAVFWVTNGSAKVISGTAPTTGGVACPTPTATS